LRLLIAEDFAGNANEDFRVWFDHFAGCGATVQQNQLPHSPRRVWHGQAPLIVECT
jgi:hypothetical protein